MYKAPCANCEKIYVGETGRKLAATASLTEHNKSALIDRATQENHMIHWTKAAVIDGESDRPTRWIKEAVHIRKDGHQAMNRDEGSCQISHAYDHFLEATADCRVKSRKN